MYWPTASDSSLKKMKKKMVNKATRPLIFFVCVLGIKEKKKKETISFSLVKFEFLVSLND